jgi:uncharacterized protein with HEPN domain
VNGSFQSWYVSRASEVYLRDILQACDRIDSYAARVSGGVERLADDPMAMDAVIRNLEIIGEAAKKIPEIEKTRVLDIQWRKFAGLRDILIHQYFGIDESIVVDVVRTKIA